MIELFEKEGVISGANGSKPRQGNCKKLQRIDQDILTPPSSMI
jgi:hypothetical protein